MSLPILNCAKKNAGFSNLDDVHGTVRIQEQGIGIRTLLRGVRARATAMADHSCLPTAKRKGKLCGVCWSSPSWLRNRL